METQHEAELDLMGLLLHLKRKIWLILVVTVVAALIGYVGAKMLTTPLYTATTQVYVYQKEADYEYMDYNGIALASQLRRDCAVVIKGESVAQEVIEELGLKMDPKALGKAIRVTTEDNTRFLNISYTASDPVLATTVVNKVREVAAVRTKELMGRDVLINTFEASLPQAETTTNIRKSTLIAAAVGAAAMTALLVIFFLLDDTIRTEDDVQTYLGLSTLAVIPLSNELHVNRGSRNGTRNRRPVRRFNGGNKRWKK
jgi:capsular polysaccharide biosynthesis protein